MKVAARLLANVKAGKFLEPGAPTGLTGLLTHPSPRSALLYHYNATLDKLQQIPESSVYRQSTEALTKHRLKIIEASKPAGWDRWLEHVQMKISDDPGAFHFIQTSGGTNIIAPERPQFDPRTAGAEWDGEVQRTFPEGIRTEKERRKHFKAMKEDEEFDPERKLTNVKVQSEPPFTEEAIHELESKFGAGLLEEVIQVAESEHKLVEAMIQAKVWEPLEEPAPEGQWSYFERESQAHTITQKP